MAEKTVRDVLETYTDEQKTNLYTLIGHIIFSGYDPTARTLDIGTRASFKNSDQLKMYDNLINDVIRSYLNKAQRYNHEH